MDPHTVPCLAQTWPHHDPVVLPLPYKGVVVTSGADFIIIWPVILSLI